jgi:hypothetical protein
MNLSKEQYYFQCLDRIAPGDRVDLKTKNGPIFEKVLVLGIQSKWFLLGGQKLKYYSGRNTGWDYMRAAYSNEFTGPDRVQLIADMRICQAAIHYAWIKKKPNIIRDGYQILKIYKSS